MKRFMSLAVASFAIFGVGLMVLPSAEVAAVSSASLSIAPKKDYVIEPGKSVDDKLTIRNLDPLESLELNLRVIDFTYTDQGGTPKLMLDPDAPQTTWSLRPFLTIPKHVSVPPASSKSIDISVAIPAGHGAGSYYSAILYSSGAPEGTGNVGLSASGVTLVFTSIPGKVSEDLQLEKFGAYFDATASEKGGYRSFMTEKPAKMGYTLKNNGNVVEAPVGSITLANMFGQKITIDDINPTRSLGLIGQSRVFTACIALKSEDVKIGGSSSKAAACADPALWPGRYTATLNAFYGQNGNNTKEIIKTVSFWYMPLWAIVVLIVVLMIVSYYIWRLTQAVKRVKSGGSLRRKSIKRRK